MFRVCLFVVLFQGLWIGCAHGITQTYEQKETVYYDPFERVNRKIFRFNQVVDRIVLKPIAKGYLFVTPKVVQSKAHNVLQNLLEPLNALNGLLQWKPKAFLTSMSRFVLNSTWGILGANDIMKGAGLDYQHLDFNTTLSYYCIPHGPYVVLPIVGPSSSRGIAGLVVNTVADPFYYVDSDGFKIGRTIGTMVDGRARVMSATDFIAKSSLDEYVTYRTLYFQQQK
ncbi:VacJ family lipoprotein [Rickettsiales endosymbiont of Peranema trichophorum]|uniref:MlaA family lipoprotein n=1 Tax=Rickettsiales endosymbiont of Peranema trichophorum TaxID=2486577 RepID=UPI001022FC7A|nr:VacJ family lipoprotein [Rickettsiales endosymbiont of Peranema trichophorum]RZI47466.1 VacJ family lipoprotein [Rickettsiales endosymbiont of Peranema trichophorum]